MLFRLRLRESADTPIDKSVFISSEEIENRFFPYPSFKRKDELKKLEDAGKLKITRKGKAYYYEALTRGGFDLSLLPKKRVKYSPLIETMKQHLKVVSLKESAESTPYFNIFLNHKASYLDLFFTVDDFSGRIHTPVTNFHRTHRPNILLNGEETGSLDVTTMQPLLLGKILSEEIGNNEYSQWINDGEDIYIKLQGKANLETRDNAKKKFFEILFSEPSNALAEMFGSSNWIEWINCYKQSVEPSNPHKEKKHTNLAWKLQTLEVSIMKRIWEQLILSDIPFLSVHDEVIVPKSKLSATEAIMNSVLSSDFQYYRLNAKALAIAHATAYPVLDAVAYTPAEPEAPIKPLDNPSEPLPNPLPTVIEEVPVIAPIKAVDTSRIKENWTVQIEELEEYFKAFKTYTEPIKLNQASTIRDLPLFLDSHLQTVKHNNGNISFKPYMDRLIQVRNIIQQSI